MQTEHITKNTESSAVLVAGAIENIYLLISIALERRFNFENAYLMGKRLTNDEKDNALKTHFKLQGEILDLKKVLNSLVSIQKRNEESSK